MGCLRYLWSSINPHSVIATIPIYTPQYRLPAVFVEPKLSTHCACHYTSFIPRSIGRLRSLWSPNSPPTVHSLSIYIPEYVLPSVCADPNTWTFHFISCHVPSTHFDCTAFPFIYRSMCYLRSVQTQLHEHFISFHVMYHPHTLIAQPFHLLLPEYVLPSVCADPITWTSQFIPCHVPSTHFDCTSIPFIYRSMCYLGLCRPFCI